MEKDLDIKLYNEYLNGEKGAFELLYNKYKDKIKYFVFNIVKDYQKAEDITQDTFIYVLQNKIDKGCSFKYYIYMIAKSRALNYIKTEKRKKEINEKYISENSEQIEKDVVDIITKNETKKELMEAINMLDEKYRNAIYLIKIENFSYKETSEILGYTMQNMKNHIHRGKKELKKILLKKGVYEMNKMVKVIVIVLGLSILLVGGAYATVKYIERINGNANLTPTYTANLGDNDINSIWIGSFQIAWNEFMDKRVKGNIEFEDGFSTLAQELNKKKFKKNMISEKDYYIEIGKTSNQLKQKILTEVEEKFQIENSQALDKINFNVNKNSKSYTIYSMLYKKFEYLIPFDRLNDNIFNSSCTMVKYFGINNASSKKIKENIEVLFYNEENDFAVTIKTKENEEIILYYNNSNKSFNDLYDEIKDKSNDYKGKKEFTGYDEIRIPYINVDTIINYGELCGREIKGTDGIYITNAVQNVKFSLNETGGEVYSEAVVKDE